MRFTEEDMEYISGKKFSDWYSLKLSGNEKIDRISKIVDICKGKNVIHIGCCDHLPLIDTRIKEGMWLQKVLDDNCESVLGIDINSDAIEYVNSRKLSRQPVVNANAISDDFNDIVGDCSKYDYVVLGEIVEHVDNPVNFLISLKQNMYRAGFKGKYIISVPNALRMVIDRNVYLGIEGINSDHRYWFSPYTIAKVVYQAGMLPQELFFVSFAKGGKASFLQRIKRIVKVGLKIELRFASYCDNTLVIVAR